MRHYSFIILGSITDSICTAYEANNVAVSTINSKENKKILAEEFEGKEVENSSLLNNEPLLQGWYLKIFFRFFWILNLVFRFNVCN